MRKTCIHESGSTVLKRAASVTVNMIWSNLIFCIFLYFFHNLPAVLSLSKYTGIIYFKYIYLFYILAYF